MTAARATVVTGFISTSVRPKAITIDASSQSSGRDQGLVHDAADGRGSDSLGPVRLASAPDGPDDARELVGEGTAGLVVASSLLDGHGPDAETIDVWL